MALPQFFSITEPTGPEIPVVVEVPHAGVFVDPPSLATLAAPGRSIGRDADLFVDDLYAEAPSLGATLLVAHVSRYVCDLNRAEADADTLAVEGGGPRAAPHGIIWRSTTDEQPALYAPLPRPEFERRMSDIYRPYHEALARILEQKHARFGHAILLCAHSMPSSGRAGHSDPGHERADVVPGSRGGTTASLAVVRAPELVARGYGWSVTHDEPYRGGYSTSHYGRPEQGVHAIQVELARRLYMDEETLAKNPNDFAKTQRFCAALVARLATISVD